MTPRACPDCGILEERTKDAAGRERTNLCPLTDRCIDCLAAWVKGKVPVPEHQDEFDPKLAQMPRHDA